MAQAPVDIEPSAAIFPGEPFDVAAGEESTRSVGHRPEKGELDLAAVRMTGQGQGDLPEKLKVPRRFCLDRQIRPVPRQKPGRSMGQQHYRLIHLIG